MNHLIDLITESNTYLEEEKGDPTDDAKTQEAYRLISLLLDRVKMSKEKKIDYILEEVMANHHFKKEFYSLSKINILCKKCCDTGVIGQNNCNFEEAPFYIFMNRKREEILRMPINFEGKDTFWHYYKLLVWKEFDLRKISSIKEIKE